MTEEQLVLDVAEDEPVSWCAMDWCLRPARVYLDGGPLWWPACSAHRATVVERLAKHGTLGPVKIRTVSGW